MNVRRTLLSSMAGGLLGALTGAALLGIPTYLSKESGFLGPYSDWALYAAFEGFVIGVIPGAVIGFVTARFRTHVLLGGVVGIAVGFLILVVLLAMGLDPAVDNEVFHVGVACIPIGGAIGLVMAVINRHRPLAPPNKSLDRSAGRVFGDLTD